MAPSPSAHSTLLRRRGGSRWRGRWRGRRQGRRCDAPVVAVGREELVVAAVGRVVVLELVPEQRVVAKEPGECALPDDLRRRAASELEVLEGLASSRARAVCARRTNAVSLIWLGGVDEEQVVRVAALGAVVPRVTQQVGVVHRGVTVLGDEQLARQQNPRGHHVVDGRVHRGEGCKDLGREADGGALGVGEVGIVPLQRPLLEAERRDRADRREHLGGDAAGACVRVGQELGALLEVVEEQRDGRQVGDDGHGERDEGDSPRLAQRDVEPHGDGPDGCEDVGVG